MLLVNKRRIRGESPKLQPRFVGPYIITESFRNHTYRVKRQGQESIQNESRIKVYTACKEAVGRAPGTREPALRPNMRGAIRKQHKRQQKLAEYDEEMLSAPPVAQEQPRREDQYNNLDNDATPPVV